MTTSYKPDGYQSVSPYLIVDGASAAIVFLTRVFNAQEIVASPMPTAVSSIRKSGWTIPS